MKTWCVMCVLWGPCSLAESADEMYWRKLKQDSDHQIPTPSTANMGSHSFYSYVAVKDILNIATRSNSNVLLVLKCSDDSKVP